MNPQKIPTGIIRWSDITSPAGSKAPPLNLSRPSTGTERAFNLSRPSIGADLQLGRTFNLSRLLAVADLQLECLFNLNGPSQNLNPMVATNDMR